jgi:hypothetical protein
VDLRPALAVVLAALALAACGRPDASGIYLAKSDRQVTLVQLAQTKAGAVAGRLETVSIGPGGRIDDQSMTLAGSASRRDLTLRPAGGGLDVTGSFSREGLELNSKTPAVKARRANLQDFQSAVARLEHVAAAERRRATDAEAKQADAAAQAAPIQNAADKAARIDGATAELRIDAAKLNAGVAGAPDFAQQAAQNTARITRMAQMASRDRNQALASANQIIVLTNQIEVARSQYATGLNRIVQRGAPLATEVQRFCESPEAAKFTRPCAEATAAATDFQSALVHAVVVFNGAKRAIQLDLARQNEMARKMGG